MKQQLKKLLSVILALFIVMTCFASCNQKQNSDVWDNAIYTSDKSFGEGGTEIKVDVTVQDKSITFTVKTDKDNLADALLEHKLIDGEDSAYGIYIKSVNGIVADFEKDGHYWSISKDSTPLLTGASDTKIKNGEHYQFTYAK